MSALTPAATWDDVTQIETTTAVLGGPGGPANVPHQELLNRTEYLRLACIPTGGVIPFAGAAAPSGFLLANGAAVSRTAYAALYALIGTTYGVGDGSTTFNLPNLTDRFPVGAGSSYALGAKGGEASHALTVEEMPSHRHTATGTYTGHETGGGGKKLHFHADYVDGWLASGSYNTYTDATFKTTLVGSGTAHNNMPPYLGLKFIIKT